MPSIKGKAAIVGIGHTEFSKDSGRSELQLCAEAVRAAISDAGLTPGEIDGSVTFTLDGNDELAVMRTVGIKEMRWTSRTPFGGGGSSATIEQATAAVVSGAADAVVVYRAFNERSGRRFGQPSAGPPAPSMNWYRPYGLDTPAKAYSLWFQRYMYRYGVTNEDFGSYSVVAREACRDQPERVVLPATDLTRGASTLPLDRRARLAPVGLLSGERRGRGVGRDES